MLAIEHTACFRALKAKCRGHEAAVARFLQARSRAEFEMLCDLFGYRDEFPAHVFVLILAHALIGSERATSNLMPLLDFASGSRPGMLDRAFFSRSFIGICGRWIGLHYMRKNKTTFWKLMQLMGRAATANMGSVA